MPTDIFIEYNNHIMAPIAINPPRNIQVWRKSLNISQEALARHLGISQPIVSHYESGEKVPTVEQQKKILHFFGLPETYLEDLLKPYGK